MPLPPRLAIPLLLFLAFTAGAQPRVTYSPNWLKLTEAEPAFSPARALFAAGDPAAIRELATLAEGDQRLVGRLAELAEDNELVAPLIADLAELYEKDREYWRRDVMNLLEDLGPARAEAVPLLLRICAEGPRSRSYAVAANALAAAADHPRMLAELINVACGPDDDLADAAIRRMSVGGPFFHPAFDPALATVVARNTAFGRHERAGFAMRSRQVEATLVGDALRTACVSAIDDAQRLNVVAAAVTDLQVFDKLRDDHPFLRELAVLTATPQPLRQVPTFRSEIRKQLLVAAAALRTARELGRPPPPDTLARLKSDPTLIRQALTFALQSTDDDLRLAAVRSLDTLDPRAVAALSRVVNRGLRADDDPDVRAAAAALLGDERIQTANRVIDLIADCRADSPTLRETAARQLEELGLFPAPLTAALRRAVAARDMPAREGLLRALERAHAAASDPMLSLQSAADAPDSATRAYARAALREIGPTGTPP